MKTFRRKLCWGLILVLVGCGVSRSGAFGLEVRAPLLSPQEVGLGVAVADVYLFRNDLPKGRFWEPFAAAFGDGTLAVATLTHAKIDLSRQRTVVCFFNADGSIVEAPAFFDENGNPWDTDNNTLRNDGNPPRIAADKRPGGTRYAIGAEVTPWAFPERFPTFGKTGNFTYDERVVCFQLLDKGSTGENLEPRPIGRLVEPIYGRDTNGRLQHGKPLRSGLEIRFLSNGNFVVSVDDQTESIAPERMQMLSLLSGEDGEVIEGPFPGNPVNPREFCRSFSNLAAWSLGFAFRLEPKQEVAEVLFQPKGGSANTIGFWSNDASFMGVWRRVAREDLSDPQPPEGGTSTTINEWGGTVTRIDSDIRKDLIYLAGAGLEAKDLGGRKQTGIYLTQIDARSRETLKEVYVSEGYQICAARVDNVFRDNALRVNVCCDGRDNVFVCWEDFGMTGSPYPQVLGRLYDDNLNPRTEPFLVFQNGQPGPGPGNGFNVWRPACAMVEGRILVAGITKTEVPALGLTANQTVATVLDVPDE